MHLQYRPGCPKGARIKSLSAFIRWSEEKMQLILLKYTHNDQQEHKQTGLFFFFFIIYFLPTNQITQDNINSVAGIKSFPIAVI